MKAVKFYRCTGFTAVDSFFVRAGDVIQAGIVFGGERLALAVPSFAALNIVLT